MEVPEDVFLEEIEFYQLGEEQIRMYREKEGFTTEKEMLLPDAEWQRRLWLLCEEPDSSRAARVFAVVSVFCILVSVCQSTAYVAWAEDTRGRKPAPIFDSENRHGRKNDDDAVAAAFI